MNKKLIVVILIPLFFSLVLSTVSAETAVYHGADTVFSAQGIAVFWAILKDKETDSSTVYMEIAELNAGNS
ncbi:MAG: hypothetical protein J7K04_14195 [Spirochaetales bacterium]|nr:hypothetical protein [Spirochaetales bacterium]